MFLLGFADYQTVKNSKEERRTTCPFYEMHPHLLSVCFTDECSFTLNNESNVENA